MSTSPHDILITPGDWNTDMHQSWTFTDTVSPSSLNYSWLLWMDLNCTDKVGFTYLSHDGTKSWLDHIAVSTSVCSTISSVHSIQDGTNLSDHNPLTFLSDFSEIIVDCPPAPQCSSSVVWSKATPEDFCRYQNADSRSLTTLESKLSDDIVSCSNLLFIKMQLKKI